MEVKYFNASKIYNPSLRPPVRFITNNNNYQILYNVKNNNDQGYLNQFTNNKNNYYINQNNLKIGNRTNPAQFNINNNLFSANNQNTVIYEHSLNQNNFNNNKTITPNYLNQRRSVRNVNSINNMQNKLIYNNNQNIINNHAAQNINIISNIKGQIKNEVTYNTGQTQFDQNDLIINYLLQDKIANKNNNNEIYLSDYNINPPIQLKRQYSHIENNPINNYVNQEYYDNYINNNNNNSNNQQLIRITKNIKLNQLVKPRGLENVGATSYMNATLQSFYHVKLLSENIINDNKITNNTKLTFCYKDLVEQLAGCKNKENYLIESGQNIFDQRLYSVKPIKFKDIISEMNKLFKGIKANDSKDLILFLLETMDTELTKRNNNIKEMELFFGTSKEDLLPQNFTKYHNSIICDIFYGFQSMKIKCKECNDVKTTYSVINIFNFPLEKIYNDLNKGKKPIQNNNKNNIYDWYYNYMNNNSNQYNYLTNDEFNKNNLMYSTFYTKQGKRFNINITEQNRKLNLSDCFKNYNRIEDLIGDNKLYCEKCQKLCDGLIKYDLYKLPKVLIILLNRGKGNYFKCDVDFPKSLNLKDYIEESTSDKIYDLISVICHIGESSMEGHFFAYCKHFDDKWYVFNDSIVSPHQENGIYNGTPYILFYQSKEHNG